MATFSLCLYSLVLALGAALVGLVIGFLIKTPPTSVSAILIAIGVAFLAFAFLMGRKLAKRWTKDEKK
jgi:ABC-type Mn2+/Zn2+ transport system permease subunit